MSVTVSPARQPWLCRLRTHLPVAARALPLHPTAPWSAQAGPSPPPGHAMARRVGEMWAGPPRPPTAAEKPQPEATLGQWNHGADRAWPGK